MAVHFNSKQTKSRDLTQMQLAKQERERHEMALAIREQARQREAEAKKLAQGMLPQLRSGKMATFRHSDVVMLGLVRAMLQALCEREQLEVFTNLGRGALVATCKVVATA